MNKSIRNAVLGGLAAIALSTGCAKYWNKVDANGGMLGSYRAPYIVLNEVGGEIMDVYKLPNAILQPEESGAGWLFVDSSGRAIHLGAGVKSIRLKSQNDELWNQYHEYHAEFEAQTYREKYNPLKKNISESIPDSKIR